MIYSFRLHTHIWVYIYVFINNLAHLQMIFRCQLPQMKSWSPHPNHFPRIIAAIASVSFQKFLWNLRKYSLLHMYAWLCIFHCSAEVRLALFVWLSWQLASESGINKFFTVYLYNDRENRLSIFSIHKSICMKPQIHNDENWFSTKFLWKIKYTSVQQNPWFRNCSIKLKGRGAKCIYIECSFFLTTK